MKTHPPGDGYHGPYRSAEPEVTDDDDFRVLFDERPPAEVKSQSFLRMVAAKLSNAYHEAGAWIAQVFSDLRLHFYRAASVDPAISDPEFLGKAPLGDELASALAEHEASKRQAAVQIAYIEGADQMPKSVVPVHSHDEIDRPTSDLRTSG